MNLKDRRKSAFPVLPGCPSRSATWQPKSPWCRANLFSAWETGGKAHPQRTWPGDWLTATGLAFAFPREAPVDWITPRGGNHKDERGMPLPSTGPSQGEDSPGQGGGRKRWPGQGDCLGARSCTRRTSHRAGRGQSPHPSKCGRRPGPELGNAVALGFWHGVKRPRTPLGGRRMISIPGVGSTNVGYGQMIMLRRHGHMTTAGIISTDVLTPDSQTRSEIQFGRCLSRDSGRLHLLRARAGSLAQEKPIPTRGRLRPGGWH